MAISNKLQTYRKEKHLTQKELANLLNVKSSTVSGWELGRNTPSIEMIQKLAKIFNVPFDVMADVPTKKSKNGQVDLKDDPVVLSYGGKPISDEDMGVIKAILSRHQND